MINTTIRKTLPAIILAMVMVFPLTSSKADDKLELVVYTYDSFSAEWGPGPKIKEAFEENCHCVLTFVGLDTSLAILGRIRLEGDNSKADVILGLDTSQIGAAHSSGLFAPHGLNNLSDRLALPEFVGEWNDPSFIPFDWGYFAFIYDTDKIKNPPNSFKELIEAENDAYSVVIQDPRTSTPGYGLMLWMRHIYGDDAEAAWQKLAPKITTVTKGWSESYSMFLDGEVDMVLSYTTSPSYHRIAEGKSNYASARFSEGHYIQVEVAGILKSTKQRDLARDFLDFLLSREAQSVVPTSNWMYPAAAGIDLPDGFETESKPPALLFDGAMIEANGKQWINSWVDALSGAY